MTTAAGSTAARRPDAPLLLLGAVAFTVLAWASAFIGIRAAFSTWAYALARTGAGRLGVSTYLVPPLVVVLGWALLDEVPPPLAVVGGAVCLAGVALSRRRGRERPPAPVAVAQQVPSAG